MKAKLLARRRISVSDDAFVEVVIWNVPEPVKGSSHDYKYSLAYVVREICVLRYDNEAGKVDHMHIGDVERPYVFTTIDRLISDFLVQVRKDGR